MSYTKYTNKYWLISIDIFVYMKGKTEARQTVFFAQQLLFDAAGPKCPNGLFILKFRSTCDTNLFIFHGIIYSVLRCSNI